MRTNLKHDVRKNGIFAALNPLPKPWRAMSPHEKYARSKEKWYMLELRLEREYLPALRTAAKKKNVAVSELIRTYIEWGLENDGEK